MKHIFFTIITKLKPSAKAIEAVAEDFRKIGVAILGISVVGLVLPDDNISNTDSFFLICCGMMCWGFGIICTHISSKHTQGGNE